VPANASKRKGEWYEYTADIYEARKIRKDPDGNLLASPKFVFKEEKVDGEFKSGSKKSLGIHEKGASLESEQVMLALQRKLLEGNGKKWIATDGGPTVFAASQLFKETDPQDLQYYEKPPQLNSGDKEVLSRTYLVEIKKGCRFDEDFAENVPDILRLVILKEVNDPILKWQCASGGSLWPQDDSKAQKFCQVINIVLKNSMLMSGCRSFGNKLTACLPDEIQATVMENDLFNSNAGDRTIGPRMGMLQSSRACVNKEIFVAQSTKVSHFHLDKFQDDRRRIPILDPGKQTIAGVKVNINECVPCHLRDTVKAALDKLTFHIIYDVNTENDKRRVVKPGVRMRLSTPEAPSILWASNDPHQYSFEASPYGTCTVCSYFQSRYGIKLRYENMPIVLTKYGWYPVELLFQSFAIMKGANDENQKMAILKFYDNKSGRAMSELKRYNDELRQFSQRGQELEEAFGFKLSDEPLQHKAKLLAEPKLEFGGGHSSSPRNGSWNLSGNKKLFRPADLPSFAVIDFSHKGDGHELVTGLLRRAAEHGLKNNQFEREYSQVVNELVIKANPLHQSGDMVQQINTALESAIQRAKDFFLRDCTNFFKQRRTLFKTYVTHPIIGKTECLVYPTGNDNLGIVYPQEVMFESHQIQFKGEIQEARMAIVVKSDCRGDKFMVDPFDFVSVERNKWEARRDESSVWEQVTFVEFQWTTKDGNVVGKDAVVRSVKCDYKMWQVECPAIIFVVFQNIEKEGYSLVKMLSNFMNGVQSQCIVKATHDRQRNEAMYYSNLVLKINAKLANSINMAHSWKITAYKGLQQGLPWIAEVPTIILGLALTKGSGKDSKTVVVGSVALVDESGSCLRNGFSVQLQSRPDVIEPRVFKEIIKTLTIHFCASGGEFPKRVLVFRDGQSEGNFPEIRSDEIDNISQALEDVWETVRDVVPGNQIFQSPKVSYVICLNQHNIQVVPSIASRAVNKNVPSGTCVDNVIMPFAKMGLAEDPLSFLLTAQGGLKGTSKPVFYRMLLNQNGSLTREVLESVVFGLSFQYPTATKATRRLSLAQYCKRLSEQLISYLPYIDGRRGSLKGFAHFPHLVVDGDGTVRSDHSERNLISKELLPDFCPRLVNGEWQAPLRPHLAA
jgi:ribosomal protein S17